MGITLLAVFSSFAVMAEQPRQFALHAGISVWDVATMDVNGDGRGDVVAVCCDEDSEPLNKYIATFLSDESGGYPAEPSIRTVLNPTVGVLFEAEIDGAAPKEILAADAEGVTAYGFWDGKLVPVREVPFVSLFPSGSREPGFLKDAAADIDGDGIDEWFVPMPSGFAIRNADGLLANIRCDVNSTIRTGSGISISNRYPAYATFAQDESPRKGIAFLSDEYADFAFGDDWRQHKRFRIPIDLDEKWDTSSNMKDIDGNGMPDLIVTQTQGTINLKALTQVYLATGPMTYSETPTATFESSGSFAAPILKDVNGDKMQDIVFVNIPFGVKFFINLFVWKKLGVDLEIYLFDGKGFASKPNFTASVSIEAPEGKEQAAYCLGDFNGDGNTDAAFGAGSNKLHLQAGGGSEFIASKPYLTVEVPSFGIAKAHNLDGNEAEDIVIYHPGIANKERIEVLLF